MSDTVIKVEGLYKKFCSNLRRSMYYGTIDVTRSMFGINYNTGIARKGEFWALQDINFELKRGETLGLIGQNGCGKTTLLRLLNGIFPPDKGKITINGRIGALIAVGAGFHPHMTGRENIFLNGIILGMSKAEIKRKFDAIVDFAEIGDFLDAPVATYSSGMHIRLGFAIAINANIDILLADEILAVGDIGFQLKCFNKIGELRNKGVATLFVSHDLHNISTFSQQLLLMEKGSQEYFGEVAEGLSLYKSKFKALHSEGEIEKVQTGTNEFHILNVSFVPSLINNKIDLNTFENLEIIIEYDALKNFNDIEVDLLLDIAIPGPHYFQASNKTFCKQINLTKGKGILNTTISSINLNNISQKLYIAIWEENRRTLLFWWRKIPIIVKGIPTSTGWTHYSIEYKNNNYAL